MKKKNDLYEIDMSDDETFYEDDVRPPSPKSGDRYEAPKGLSSAIKSVISKSGETKKAVREAQEREQPSPKRMSMQLEEGGGERKLAPVAKTLPPVSRAASGQPQKAELKEPPKREYDEYIKSSSPKYQANEARYQKLLKSSGGSAALAYKRAKASGDKAASEKFMKMMKEISKRPVKSK